MRAYVESLPDIQQAHDGTVPSSGLAADLYENEQQNARKTREAGEIVRDALGKVDWLELVESLREE